MTYVREVRSVLVLLALLLMPIVLPLCTPCGARIPPREDIHSQVAPTGKVDVTLRVYPDHWVKLKILANGSYPLYPPLRPVLYPILYPHVQARSMEVSLIVSSTKEAFMTKGEWSISFDPAAFVLLKDFRLTVKYSEGKAEGSLNIDVEEMLKLRGMFSSITDLNTGITTLTFSIDSEIWYVPYLIPRELIEKFIAEFHNFRWKIIESLYWGTDGHLSLVKLELVKSEVGPHSAKLSIEGEIRGDFIKAFEAYYRKQYMPYDPRSYLVTKQIAIENYDYEVLPDGLYRLSFFVRNVGMANLNIHYISIVDEKGYYFQSHMFPDLPVFLAVGETVQLTFPDAVPLKEGTTYTITVVSREEAFATYKFTFPEVEAVRYPEVTPTLPEFCEKLKAIEYPKLKSLDLDVTFHRETRTFMVECESVSEGDMDKALNELKNLYVDYIRVLVPYADEKFYAQIKEFRDVEISVKSLIILFTYKAQEDTATLSINLEWMGFKPPVKVVDGEFSIPLFAKFREIRPEDIPPWVSLSLTIEGGSTPVHKIQIGTPPPVITPPVDVKPEKVKWDIITVAGIESVAFMPAWNPTGISDVVCYSKESTVRGEVYQVEVHTNSTFVEDIDVTTERVEIKVFGFLPGAMNVTIPKALGIPRAVFVDGKPASKTSENATHSFVYVEYEAGSRTITIIFTPPMPLSIYLAAAASVAMVIIVAAVYARVRKRKAPPALPPPETPPAPPESPPVSEVPSTSL